MTRWKSRGHRGDVLEDLIVLTNEFYKNQGLGRIDKVHVPIKVIEIDGTGMITKAFFEKKSTVDFQGIMQGIGIVFDVKETALKSLPLSNIHLHQVEFMEDIDRQKGLSFIIIHFKFCDEYYLIPLEHLIGYYRNPNPDARKSIPYKQMDPAFKIERPVNGILNYLPLLNTYLDYKAKGLFLNMPPK